MKRNRIVKLLATGAVGAIALTTAIAQESTPAKTTTATTDPAKTVTNSTSTITTATDSTAVASSATTTVATTMAEGSGTVVSHQTGPDFILFQTSPGTAPVMYYYNKSTTIVDPDGKPIQWSMLKPHMEAKFTYVKEPDRMVITKITLTKPVSSHEKKETKEKTTTTTTTTNPKAKSKP